MVRVAEGPATHTPQNIVPTVLLSAQDSLSTCLDWVTNYLRGWMLVSWGPCKKTKEEAAVPADPEVATKGGPTVFSGKRGRFSPVHSSVWKGPGHGADS